MKHRIAFKIRCEERSVFYVYHTSAGWSEYLERATVFDTREEAKEVADALEIPRTAFRDKRPVVFSFNR
jgi:hypothetical protein